MITGGCRCGACRYEIAVDQLPAVYCCHCTNCQRWSGSAFAEQAPVPADSISATGPVVEAEVATPSGARSLQRVCGQCHARLWNTNSTLPEIAMVRAGTLDDNLMLEPRLHIWVKSKQPWVVLAPGIPAFDVTPSKDEFLSILAR